MAYRKYAVVAVFALALLAIAPLAFSLGFGANKDPLLIEAPRPTDADAPQVVGIQVTVATPTPTPTPTTSPISPDSASIAAAQAPLQNTVEKPVYTPVVSAPASATRYSAARFVHRPGAQGATPVSTPPAECDLFSSCGGSESEISGQCGSNTIYSFGCTLNASGKHLNCYKKSSEDGASSGAKAGFSAGSLAVIACIIIPGCIEAATALVQKIIPESALASIGITGHNAIVAADAAVFIGATTAAGAVVGAVVGQERTWQTGCELNPSCGDGSVRSEEPCVIPMPATQYCCKAASNATNQTNSTPGNVSFSEPTPSGVVGRNNVTINATLSAPADSVILSWNNANESMTAADAAKTNWVKNKTGVADGNYSLRVYALAAGSTSSSETRWIAIGTTPASIAVSPGTAALTAGATRQFNASANNSYGSAIEFDYFSPTWSAVNNDGTLALTEYFKGIAVFQARKAGSNKARAASGSVYGEANVAITPGELAEIRISGDTSCMYNFGMGYWPTCSVSANEFQVDCYKPCTKEIYAHGYDAYGNEVPIVATWGSSDPELVSYVASMTSAYQPSNTTALFVSNSQNKYGKATIYASYNNVVGSYRLDLTSKDPAWYAYPAPQNNSVLTGVQEIKVYAKYGIGAGTLYNCSYPNFLDTYVSIYADGALTSSGDTPAGVRLAHCDMPSSYWDPSDPNARQGWVYCSDHTCTGTCTATWNTSQKIDGLTNFRAYVVGNPDFDECDYLLPVRVEVLNNTGNANLSNGIGWVEPTIANGSRLSGTQKLRAWSNWNDFWCARFFVQGQGSLGSCIHQDASAPRTDDCNVSWDTTTISDGSYDVKAQVTDCFGGVLAEAAEVRTVTVDNSVLQVSLVSPSPANASLVSGVNTIRATASKADNIKVYVDGSLKATCTASPCDYAWNTASYSDSLHSFYATASNSTTTLQTETRYVNTDNTPPNWITISPLNGATVAENHVTVSVTFNGNVASCTLDFDAYTYDMNGAGTSACSYDVTGLQAGTHEYYVHASDAAGNVLAIGPRYVSVQGPDTTGPVVSFVYPTPANNEGIPRTWVFVNVTTNEPTQQAVLEWSLMTNYSMTKASDYNFYYNKTGLVNGPHFFKVYAQDVPGNWGVSSTRAVNVSTVNYITSCGTITQAGAYFLASDLNSTGTCITFANGLADTTLDCQKHSITGPGSGSSYGISMSGGQRNTVKNCVVKKHDVGIYLSASSNNNIEYNSVNASNSYGIYLSGSSGNTLRGNNATSSGQFGIDLSSSSGNTITNNRACSNSLGDMYATSTQTSASGNTCGTSASPLKCYQGVDTVFCHGIETASGWQDCTYRCSS
jgi:parallel beta-helix repeat protein